MIKAQALTRKYGDVLAVNDISFEIDSGEIVGLLGHNGAGKTTIMKMITGFLEPSAGSVSINGADVWSERKTTQSQVGYLPENCPLYPEMHVLEYLEYAATLRNVPDNQKRVQIADVVEKTSLVDVAMKPVSSLSRGYRQRLGVAQALLNKPRILILDEPTNGLDPSQILEMRSLIKEVATAATVVVSTHILQEVQAICSRVIIINKGRIALDSSMESLKLTNRVRIVTDNAPATFAALLDKLNGFQIAGSEEINQRHNYVVDAGTQDAAEAAAAITKALVKANSKVFAVHPIARDLESIFGEITSTGARPGVSN